MKITLSSVVAPIAVRWVRPRAHRRVNLFHIIILMTILLAISLHAQTEISGVVSGEWTTEDSPYIVTDSIWVPDDFALLINAGVTVKFQENQGLTVYGDLIVEGTEEDSVYFIPAEGDAPADTILWRGLELWGENEELYEFSYLSISNCQKVFDVKRNTEIELFNSRIRSRGDFHSGGCRSVSIEDCDIYAPGEIGVSTFTAKNSTVKIRSMTWGGSGEIYNCEVYGTLGTFEYGTFRGDLINSNFYHWNDSTASSIRVNGNVLNCELSVSFNLNGRYQPNYTLKNSKFRRVGIEGGNISVDSCEFTSGMYTEYFGSLHISNSVIYGTMEIEGGGDVTIENSNLVGEGNDSPRGLYFGGVGSVMISNCAITTQPRFIIVDEIEFANNTLVHPSGQRDFAWFIIDSAIKEVRIVNNIFYRAGHDIPLFYYRTSLDSVNLELEYNCMHGYSELFDRHFNEFNPQYEPPESNLTLDPRLTSATPLDPYLLWNSPCIDAGDPDSPEDPDGSRADMGAIWHDRELHVDEIFQPETMQLQVYPNPFNSTTSFEYTLPTSGDVTLRVYDVTGRLVYEQLSQNKHAGRHRSFWHGAGTDGRTLTTGIYFIELEHSSAKLVHRAILLK